MDCIDVWMAPSSIATSNSILRKRRWWLVRNWEDPNRASASSSPAKLFKTSSRPWRVVIVRCSEISSQFHEYCFSLFISLRFYCSWLPTSRNCRWKMPLHAFCRSIYRQVSEDKNVNLIDERSKGGPLGLLIVVLGCFVGGAVPALQCKSYRRI